MKYKGKEYELVKAEGLNSCKLCVFKTTNDCRAVNGIKSCIKSYKGTYNWSWYWKEIELNCKPTNKPITYTHNEIIDIIDTTYDKLMEEVGGDYEYNGCGDLIERIKDNLK